MRSGPEFGTVIERYPYIRGACAESRAERTESCYRYREINLTVCTVIASFRCSARKINLNVFEISQTAIYFVSGTSNIDITIR